MNYLNRYLYIIITHFKIKLWGKKHLAWSHTLNILNEKCDSK